MRIVERFPHAIDEKENVWIPMPDGCRLAARLWLPRGAPDRPVPAVLEYIPYRKRDGTRERDEAMHRYFAGHGYAAVRVDLRGSGESDGLLLDEYLEQEQRDGVEVIHWIASQPWCDGRVGMIGKSWGGFNALQVAARRPEPLRAILTVCATDDRYADDAHYMGGCLLNENVIWGSILHTINALPPDPALVGDRWREKWRERIEGAPLYPEIWLRHPHRDAYWKQGSVCEQFDRIRCAVYAVSGWADGYTNAVPRLLAGLTCPRKGLVGPWAHVYPHEGIPGPAIGFLQEALRWWDHWLKEIDTGILDEPMYRVWMQDSAPPASSHSVRTGRWVAEVAWPSDRIEQRTLCLRPYALTAKPGRARRIRFRSPLVTGLDAGSWCGFGDEGEMPGDQRADDGHSLVFDTKPLKRCLEILGAPVVRLHVAADAPAALLAVRLNDVAEDGSSSRVSYGLINLTHRKGHERALPLEPGRGSPVEVRLGDAAHSFQAGHRIRIAISTSYWPVAWPSPEMATVTLELGESTLTLPVRPPRAGDATLRPFDPPESAPASPVRDLGEFRSQRTIRRDLLTGQTRYVVGWDLDAEGEPDMARVEEIDLETGHGVIETFTIREGDPLSARTEILHRCRMRRPGWSIRVDTRLDLSGTRDTFRLRAEVVGYEDDREAIRRAWDCAVPRDGV